MVEPRRPASERSALADADVARERLREMVRSRPLVALGAAATVGGVVGGVLFSRLGRLACAAVAGYVAHELWHREGRS
jgi:hypothetical protein